MSDTVLATFHTLPFLIFKAELLRLSSCIGGNSGLERSHNQLKVHLGTT